MLVWRAASPAESPASCVSECLCFRFPMSQVLEQTNQNRSNGNQSRLGMLSRSAHNVRYLFAKEISALNLRVALAR